LDEKETPMFSFSNISERSFIKIENRVGERIHPCLTPRSWSNHSDLYDPKITLFSTLQVNALTKTGNGISEMENKLMKPIITHI
jgi:hypothetical protein